MPQDENMENFYVNDIFVDPQKHLVISNGVEKEVSARSMNLLLFLIENQSGLVTYDQIVERIWSRGCSENALYKQMAILRKVLDDNANESNIIKTIPKVGYRFVGKIRPGKANHEVQEDSSLKNSESKKNRNLYAYCFMFIVATILLSVAVKYYSSNEGGLDVLSGEISNPKLIIAIEALYFDPETHSSGEAELMASVLYYHINRSTTHHASFLPLGCDSLCFAWFKNHVEDVATLEFSLKVNIADVEGMYLIELVRNSDDGGKSVVFKYDVEKEHFSRWLETYEKDMLEYLVSFGVEGLNSPVLTNEQSNKYLTKASLGMLNQNVDIEATRFSIDNAEKSIDFNGENLFSYVVLWDSVYRLIVNSVNFDVYRISELLERKAIEILDKHPEFYKAHHAMAEHSCYSGRSEECANHLATAFELEPNDARILNTAVWLNLSSHTTTAELALNNYIYNPFEFNVAELYRTSLADVGRFVDTADMALNHSRLISGSEDIFFNVQGKTTRESLSYIGGHVRVDGNSCRNSAPNFDAVGISGTGESQNTSIDSGVPKNSDLQGPPGDTVSASPKYLGYFYLDINRPDLARSTVRSSEGDRALFFDLRAVGLLSDIYEQKWNSLLWQSERSRVMERVDSQNALDKLYIAYFDFIDERYNNSLELLKNTFPEFLEEKPKIDQDNMRFATYYSEIRKRQGLHKDASELNFAIREYLKGNGVGRRNNAYFGLADIEFYALNSEQEKALVLLEEAVVRDGWLPNSYWLWPPLEHNVFLRSLRGEERFQKLVTYQNSVLEEYSDQAHCE